MAEAAVAEVLAGSGGIALGAGLAMGLSALGAGLSQGAMGSAAIGAMTERPEMEKNALIYIVLPEVLAVFGFLIAVLLWLKIGGA
ncbi:MAG: ATPase [Candidatus ainarchaeum sp.]|nr:ATPase [Candidatus ainarchaeum sp.]